MKAVEKARVQLEAGNGLVTFNSPNRCVLVGF